MKSSYKIIQSRNTRYHGWKKSNNLWETKIFTRNFLRDFKTRIIFINSFVTVDYRGFAKRSSKIAPKALLRL